MQSLKDELKALSMEKKEVVRDRRKVVLLNKLAHSIHRSDAAKAEKYAREALTLAKKLYFDKEKSRAYQNIGLSQSIKGEYDNAISNLFKAVANYNKTQSDNYIASCYKSIATVYRYKSDYKKALVFYAKARRIWEKVKNRKSIASSYSDSAGAYYELGEYNTALENLRRALGIYQNINYEKGMVNCYGNMATIHMRQGDYDWALEYYLKTLQFNEKEGSKRDIALANMNIGNIYVFEGDYDQALACYSKSLKLYKEVGDKNGIAAVLLNYGFAYIHMRVYDKAFASFSKSLKIKQKIGDKAGVARCYQNIGDIYYYQGDYEQAIDNHSRSLKIWQSIKNREGIAGACNCVANAYLRTQRFDAARTYLRKALRIAEQLGVKHSMVNSYRGFAELYKMQSKYRLALKCHEKYAELEKEIYNTEKSKQITEMQTKYETEKKEKEAEIQRLKNVELKKEIRKRKKAEKELNKHRKHLEKMVQERTAQLRSLTHELSMVEERQRRKIATYLHDEISQKLALVAFKLESLQEHSSHADIKGEFDELMKVLDQTTQRIRSLTFEISPPILYELGFEPAVEWLLENFGNQYGVACNLMNDGELKPMSDDTRVLLFQSVRELLVNVAKHAQAQNIKVTIARGNHAIKITVKDDGRGFDTGIIHGKIKGNKGFGLFSIKERLDYLNGSIEIRSKIGKGTTVSLQAPLERMKKRDAKRKK